MLKRVMAFTLILCICITFAACGGSKQADNNSSQSTVQTGGSTQKAEGTDKLFSEKVELTMMIPDYPSWPYKEDWFIKKLIEEKTNVTLKITPVEDSKYVEKQSLVMASGTPNDITFCYGPGNPNQYGMQGAFVNVLDNMDKLPNFKAFAEKNPDALVGYYASDGKLYCFPNYGQGIGSRRFWFYRKDIFDKNNLKVPSTPDEFHTVLKKLKELYPDSYPFGFREGQDRLNTIISSWDAYGSPYLDSNDKMIYGPIQENYKTALKFFAQLYKEKLIPQDLYSMNTEAWIDMMVQGKTMITCDYVIRLADLNKAGKEQNLEFQLEFMPPLNGKIEYTAASSTNLAVAKSSPKVNEAMKFVDWFYRDDVVNMVSWGVEGKTYTVTDGNKKYIGDNARKDYGIGTCGFFSLYDEKAMMASYTPECIKASTESPKYEMPKNQANYLAFTDKEQEVLGTIGQNIGTYSSETTALFILGQKSLDEWDSYVKQTNDMELNKLLEVYQAAYDRIKKK